MTKGGIHRFRLYVLGNNPAGKRAMINFEKIARALFGNQADLEVVDILQDPARAEEDRIIAVPALVRLSPLPSIKIIGDLTDTPNLRAFFGF